ncbi:NUDIX domain-containing protein [Candidatus Peregrinibacteria bacterium]|nr:NUDIX domain-containing protein [Candidatus Peregrinibacteria bacterium]
MDLDYQEKSCGIILFREEDEKKFLILHYPGGHFDFPKGHIEDHDNSEHDTALRELKEETGIENIEFIDGYREEISYKPHKDNDNIKLVVFFLGKTSQKHVTVSHEHLDHYWLPYDSAYNKVTFDNAKNLLKKAKEFLD